MIQVEIDPHSGFCGGVIRAIGTAEDFLTQGGGTLYSLGSIVHNEEELARLAHRGLHTIGAGELETLEAGDTVLIRAHGEPPSTYHRLRELGLDVIDCTCPVVLRLQQSIREASARAQTVIFGKHGHPEVLGLVGQTDGRALVVEDEAELQEALAGGAIDAARPVELFSQTTKDPEEYASVAEALRQAVGDRLTVHRSICGQVASRHRDLEEFARSHDVVVFVSGTESSNGRVLFEWCRSINPRTYRAGSAAALDRSWFDGARTAGVCGATSTPKWLLEQVAKGIENLQ